MTAAELETVGTLAKQHITWEIQAMTEGNRKLKNTFIKVNIRLMNKIGHAMGTGIVQHMSRDDLNITLQAVRKYPWTIIERWKRRMQFCILLTSEIFHSSR